ncbi:T9SS type A sorting domain-containing protein [Polaribacter sp. IC073]|uniref:T9SS type A sorting domain-containing protein n=1 Tax=Polaribacter sp. IC073 TaxID=2508540 RepID=UPI0011BE3255|nr:T9SS type A sorting domain-containing protein [Polaribacter sp. IC073]TXD47242.1 T9SS type A sorting domain-containing protein [Polaribacter sp. IC073]
MKTPLKMTMVLAMILCNLSVSGQIFTEDFESSTFPPVNWSLATQNTNETWSLDAKAAASGTNSAKVTYDERLAQQNETLLSPNIDLTSAVKPSLEFSFAMSYFWSVAPNNNYDFTVSIIDGTTTTVLWSEADAGAFNDYIWTKVTLDLTPFAGKNNLKLSFNYNGLDGANLSLDAIKIEETAVLSADKEELASVSFFPNPVKNILSFNTTSKVDEIIFYNVAGKEILKSNTSKNQIDISKFSKGVYLLKVASKNKTETYKIIKE